MLELLNFFEGEEGGGGLPGYVMWIILGALVVGFILLMIIPQRKQKKRAAEMMSKLAIGSIVTTIGGIVGEVVELNDTHIWLLTGVEGNKTTMQFVRQAIHSIAPAAGATDTEFAKSKEDEVDEIK